MKKITCLLLILVVSSLFTACSKNKEEPKPNYLLYEDSSTQNNSTSEEEVTTEYTEYTENDIDETIDENIEDEVSTEIEGYRNTSLEGRGRSDGDREEPNYKYIIGYVSAYSEYDITRKGGFLKTPWVLPTYKKDKQFYEENGTIPHKTEVLVLDQELEHKGYGNYSGYLLVKRLDNNEECYIDVKNFITNPYWEYEDIVEAVKIGNFVAEFNQVSDYYPVRANGEKYNLSNGQKVYVEGRASMLAGSDKANTQTNNIECIIFNGVDDIHIYINEDDLKLIY